MSFNPAIAGKQYKTHENKYFSKKSPTYHFDYLNVQSI